MTEVPTTSWNSNRDGETGTSAAPFAADWKPAGMIAHVFTHFELRLTVYRADIADVRDNDGHGWWEPVANLDREALPTVMKKAIAAAIPHAFRKAGKKQYVR
jgi:A/G-specific adenine glycosylase